MYTPVVMTETYQIVQRSAGCADLDEAKKNAKLLQLEVGQMHVVIDDQNLIQWKGGLKSKRATAAAAARRETQSVNS